jgi:hypothetical protein
MGSIVSNDFLYFVAIVAGEQKQADQDYSYFLSICYDSAIEEEF